MSLAIPLIRAGVLSPIFRWATDHCKDIDQLLSAADLAYASEIDIHELVPLRSAVLLLSLIAETEGPDIAWRVSASSDIEELGLIGRAAMAATTPREALSAISRNMSKHCTHELIEVRQTPAGMIIGEGWTIRFEQEIHHYIQQYVTSLVYSIFRLTGADEGFFKHVSMVPHPKYGLAHLTPWLHVQPVASVDGYLRIEVESQWANRAFAKSPELSGSVHADSNADVIDPALENTARTVLKLHMMAGKPSVDRLVRVAGCSRRTLQRALAERGATFQSLLEDVRQEVGTAELLQGKLSRADIAVRLGYSRQSTLSHAIRRWKGRRSIS